MATRGPQSVLDRRQVESTNSDKVLRDRLTRQRSPARSPKRLSYSGSEEEEVVVNSRIAQPYRTSFSAVLAPARTKRDRSRSTSPCSSLKSSDRSRSKSPGGRRSKPKHVTYDTQVVIRESGTQDSIYTQLSDKDLNESSGHFSAESSLVSSDNSTMSDVTSSDYSSQLRELSQQIVDEYSNAPRPNGTSPSSHPQRNSRTPNGNMKMGYSEPYSKHSQRPALTVAQDYAHDRTVSYRVAIQNHYSDEVKQMADAMVEEVPPHSSSDEADSAKISESCPQIDRRSSLPVHSREEESSRLTPAKRSVSNSISNFFRRLSPKLGRKSKKANLSNASSHSEGISDGLDHQENNQLSRGKFRRSFMKLIGKSPSKSKHKYMTGSSPALIATCADDGIDRVDIRRDNGKPRQMPHDSNRYLKSIEQRTRSDGEVYNKFKERQSPGRTGESNPPASKPHPVRTLGVTSPAPVISQDVEADGRHTKANPPNSLDVRVVPKSVKSLQVSVMSTISADDSIGECSLNDNLTGSDPSLLTQSTESKKVVLSQSSQDAVSPRSLSPLVTSTPSISLSATERHITSPSHEVNGQNGDLTHIPKLADPANFQIEETPRTPSYLRISSALSGYGQYSRYSAYKGIEKRSPYSSTLSLRSSKSDLTSPLSPDMPIGKVPNYAPVVKSAYYLSRNGSASDKHFLNGQTLTHANGHYGHIEAFPTGDCKKDGNYFLGLTEVEETRLLTLCSRCELELLSDSLSEEASGKLRVSIGKANLLISQKFRQFKDLCQQHITPEPGTKPTLWEDLQGFWDMIKIQVDDIDLLFTEIDLMRENGWREVKMQSRRSSSSSSPKSGSMTASNTSTPSHTPGSRRKAGKVKDTPESSPERIQKAKLAAKAREEARKKMLAEKRAAMKQAHLKDRDVEIYESGKSSSNSSTNGQEVTDV